MPKTMEELVLREKKNYKNVIFFYAGQQYVLEQEAEAGK